MIDHSDEHLNLSDNPNVDSIGMLIGKELLEKLSIDLGGKRLFIPAKPGPNTPLAASIGLDAALRICAIYSGMMFDVPLDIGKHARIRQLLAEGLTAPAIAHKLRVSRFTVMRVAKITAGDRQPDLFSIDKE